MAVTPLNIAELDYDQILTNLVNFMKTDPTFADYDFSASGLRLIARVLAYVVFYQNYYMTAAANEGFLDTAQLRSSVASHARMLGYNLMGTVSAQFFANVSVAVSNSSVTFITLPAYSQFSLASNTTFNFYNLADAQLTLNSTSGFYEASGVQLAEGRPLTYRFTVDLSNPAQRFIIPNANVDYTTIAVQVQASASSNVVTQFQPAGDLMIIGANDAVFFAQEAYDGLVELKFGNGVVGQPLADGNIIIAQYFISHGSDANGFRGPFTIQSPNVAGFVSGTTIMDGNTVPSMGGIDTQSLDDARFLAPLTYQAQNRCVTADDYKTIILQSFGAQIGSINVFGGEQGDPTDPLNRPAYGRVFVVLKPAAGLRFTDAIKQNILQNILLPHSIVGIIPEIVDPDYTYLNISTSVTYDATALTITQAQLEVNISNSILTFAQSNIEKFDSVFRFSRFIRVIDDTDPSILSSVTRIDLEQRIYPQLGVSTPVTLKFNSPLRKNQDGSAILEATDHRFTYAGANGTSQTDCFLYEQNGTVSVAFRNANGDIQIFVSNIGSADSNTGLISLSSFAPTAIEDDQIDVRVRVVPAISDFTPTLNQLFTIDPTSGVSIQLLNEATATANDQLNFFVGGVLP